MKALLIFSLMLFHVSWAQGAAYIHMDASMENDFNTAIKHIIEESLDEESRDPGVTPSKEGLKEPFFDLVYGMYISGYISTTGYEQFKDEYNALTGTPSVTSTNPFERLQQIASLKSYFRNFFASKFAYFKANPQKCTEYLGMANHGQCCQGLIMEMHAEYPYPSNSCKKDSMECSKHSQCCNGVCGGLEDSPDGKGSCEPVKTCFQEIALNKECGANNPICKDRESGAACIKIEGSIALTPNGGECGNADDCRSGKCEANRCVESMQCKRCVKSGGNPNINQECCPGLYKSMGGTCVQDWPPFILPQTTEIKKPSLFKVIISKLTFIESALAQDPDPSTLCRAPCNHISHLPADERKNIEDRQRSCIEHGSEDNPVKECLEQILNEEQALYAKHKEDGTISSNVETDAMEDYVGEYNIPHVTAEGLSNVKECRFNSMKDDWNDASNLEKNAEVTLRAFEYVYSGNGADYWKETANGTNIFERVKEVSKDLRESRYNYINNLRKNDIRMACLCIASFGGVSKFPDRASFFANNCNDPLIEEEIKGLEIADNGGNNVDGEGGAASNSDQANSMDNLNHGASGISHEILLVKWLDARKTIQMDRFTANIEIEGAMEEVIDYIRTEPWHQKNVAKSKLLYKYAIKWTAGWIAWVAVITGIGAIIALGQALSGNGGLWWNSGVNGIAIFGASLALMQDPNLAPNVFDKKVKNKECWNRILGVCTARYHGFERSITYTRSEACNMNGPSFLCLKNAYLSPKTDFTKKDGYYLIDIQSPLFVSPSKISYNTNFTGKVDQAFNKGFTLLQKTKPHKYKSKHGGWNYERRSKGYENRNIFTQYYYNDNGEVKYNYRRNGYKMMLTSFAPNFNLGDFNASYKKAFMDGVKAYASCYNLKKCLQDAGLDQGYGSQGGTAISNELANFSEKDIGFKLFFANSATEQINEEELTAFAEYAYQLHYLWPNTSEKNSLSYPLPGMVPYFEAILYNIKLLGSLNAERGERYSQAWMAYDGDLQDRITDYNVTAGKMGLGEKSRNVKYGKKFFAKFKTLDLAGGGNIGAYQNMLDEAIKSGDFNSAELSALKAGTSKAIRAANDKKRYAHYKDTVGKTASGKKTIEKAKSFLKDFNSPINSFPAVAGSRFGSSAPQSKSLASSKEVKPESAKTQSYKPVSFPQPSYPSNYSSGSANYGQAEQLNNSISNAEVEHMIMSSDKDKSLYDENPDDTLFTRVSKAYKRNLGRMLVRKNDLAVNSSGDPVKTQPTHSDISREDKEQLKSLLEKN